MAQLIAMTTQRVEAELARLAADAARFGGVPRALAMRAAAEWTGPASLVVDGMTVPIVVARSPLAVHEALARHDGEPLVILTPCHNNELPFDVRARLVDGRVRNVDLFDSLRAMFCAEVIDPLLIRERGLCELLVSIAPAGGHEHASDSVLGLDHAWATFDRWCFGGPIAGQSDSVLVAFADASVAAADALRSLDDDVVDLLSERWRPTGLPVHSLIGLVVGCSASTIVPIGLAYGAAFADNVPAVVGENLSALRRDTLIRLESALPSGSVAPPPAHDELRAWADAAKRLACVADRPRRTGWTRDAEQLLTSRHAQDLAIASDILPDGYHLRLAAAGRALQSGNTSDCVATVDFVRAHHDARAEPERVQRLDVAARAANRAIAAASGVGLPALAADYLADGRWVDAAREVLAGGDSVPELADAYTALIQSLTAERERHNAAFARALAEWSVGEPLAETAVPIESVLERIVAPVAEATPVLLVVMDGLSHPASLDLLDALARRGWYPASPPGGRATETVVAMLPTITEVSRASLLCGQRVTGDQKVEVAGFAAHPALRQASRGGAAPRLFHKSDLIGPGGLALGTAVTAAIADPRQRVVGVVVNAVDDHLGSGDQIVVSWGPTSIPALGWALDAALASGRAVVIVADHGHVVERGGSPRSVTGEQGERWHTGAGPAPDGEVEIRGPRVLKGGGRVVLPYVEGRRFNNHRKRGYHGGATPQEVLAPCYVIAHHQAMPEGFAFARLAEPGWWRPDVEPAFAPPTSPPVVAPTPGRGRRSVDGEQSLFPTEPVVASEGAPPSAEDWADRVIGSPLLDESRPRAARRNLTMEQAAAVLRAVGPRGRLSRTSLAARVGVLEHQVVGLVSSVRQLVNVDGAAVLTDDGTDVVLDLAVVEQQFGVKPS